MGNRDVLTKTIDGVVHEPFEALTVDIDEATRAPSWKRWAAARPSSRTANDGRGRCASSTASRRADSSGSRGVHERDSRTGLQSHIFDGYAPLAGDIPDRHNGVLSSSEPGLRRGVLDLRAA